MRSDQTDDLCSLLHVGMCRRRKDRITIAGACVRSSVGYFAARSVDHGRGGLRSAPSEVNYGIRLDDAGAGTIFKLWKKNRASLQKDSQRAGLSEHEKNLFRAARASPTSDGAFTKSFSAARLFTRSQEKIRFQVAGMSARSSVRRINTEQIVIFHA